MSLVSNINLLATAIRDKFNLVTPRLIPSGGSTGQVLSKTSNADNAVAWANSSGVSEGKVKAVAAAMAIALG